MLDRVVKALGIKDTSGDVAGLQKKIVSYLLDVEDIQAIPKMNRLYVELCNGRKYDPAETIARCIDHLFPLYFSPDVIEKATRQLKRQGVVVIEATVASTIGAEIVMAVHDEGPATFELRDNEPHGKDSVSVPAPPIGYPSHDDEVLKILEHMDKKLHFSLPGAGSDGSHRDVAKRTRSLVEDLNGFLDYYKPDRGRSLYCVVQKHETKDDWDSCREVFELLQGKVPRLVLIALDPEASERRGESMLRSYLLRRSEAIPQRPSP